MANKEGEKGKTHGHGNSGLVVSDQEQDLAQTALSGIVLNILIKTDSSLEAQAKKFNFPVEV